MRNAILLAGLAICLVASDAVALTLTNASRELIVRLFREDPGGPTKLLEDGDEKVITEGEVFTQSQSVFIGASASAGFPLFEARGGMTASGVFGFEAMVVPDTLPQDVTGDRIPHTVEARLKMRTLFLNRTNQVFQFDSSFFINGGEFVAGFSTEQNIVSYNLDTYVGPSVMTPTTTSPQERFDAYGSFSGFDFDPVNNVFTELGTSLNPLRDDNEGKLTVFFQQHTISNRSILPNEQIAVNYDLVLRIETDGQSEGPLSFFFNDPLNAGGLPDDQGQPGLPAIVSQPQGPVAAVPVPFSLPLMLAGIGSLCLLSRRSGAGVR